MSDTQQRTLSGGAIGGRGGLAIGAVAGNAGLGAAIGAGAGNGRRLYFMTSTRNQKIRLQGRVQSRSAESQEEASRHLSALDSSAGGNLTLSRFLYDFIMNVSFSLGDS